MSDTARYVILLVSVAVAAVIGYRFALHGAVGAGVLAVMTLTLWVAHERGKWPAYEFLRVARNNALSAADEARDAYGKQNNLVKVLSGEMTHEEHERRSFQAQAQAAYRRALADAMSAQDSEFECVQAVGGELEVRLKQRTPEEFMNRGWGLFKDLAGPKGQLNRS